MQLFRDVEIPLRRFRLLMHNQSLNVNQIDMMDSTSSLVDYFDRGGTGNGNVPPADYRSRAQLTENA
jgi:hypothetical protein